MDLLQKHLNELLETITSYSNNNQNSQNDQNFNSTPVSSSSSSSAFLGPKQTTNNSAFNSLTCNSLVNAGITNTSLLATTIPSVLSNNDKNDHQKTKSPSCSTLNINKSSSLINQKPTSNHENTNQIACKLEDILKNIIQVITNVYLLFY